MTSRFFGITLVGLAAMAVAGCSTSGGGSASGAAVPSVQAVAFLNRHCLSAPYDAAANVASFAGAPSFVAKGNDFKTENSSTTAFKHTSLDMEGSAGELLGKPSCSITYRPDGPRRKNAVDAAILLTALADPGARPSGLKGQGIITWAYKGGRMSLFARQNSRTITLSVNEL